MVALTNLNNDFEFVVWVLSNLFSQCKNSLCWRSTHDISSLIALAKTQCYSISAENMAKNILSIFLTPTRTWKCSSSAIESRILLWFCIVLRKSQVAWYRRRELSCINFIRNLKLAHITSARGSYSFTARNLKSCFPTWNTPVATVSKQKNAQKTVADSHRREFRVVLLEIQFPVQVESPRFSKLHQAFLLRSARFTALCISAVRHLNKLRWPNTVFTRVLADAIRRARGNCKKNKHAVDTASTLFVQCP